MYQFTAKTELHFFYTGYDLIAQPGKEVFYFWAETYTVQDCSEYWNAIVNNRTPSEAYEATVQKGIQ